MGVCSLSLSKIFKMLAWDKKYIHILLLLNYRTYICASSLGFFVPVLLLFLLFSTESKFSETFVYFDESWWHFQATEIQASNDTAENNDALTLNQKTHDFISTMQIQQLRPWKHLYRIQMCKSRDGKCPEFLQNATSNQIEESC